MPEVKDPWPWICGILAAANAFQFLAASKDRQQSRKDLMDVLPVAQAMKDATVRLLARLEKE